MTDQMISPSTTMKIATAIRKMTVYSSRIWAPWLVTAIGGKSPVTNVSPILRTSTPNASRNRLTTMIAAPTLSAKIAVRVAFDLGELDINVLEDGQRLGGRDDRCGQQARS